MINNIKSKKGITLVALVITIIIMLILTAVTFNVILDENGVVQRSKQAKSNQRFAIVEERVQLWQNENKIRENNGESIIKFSELVEELEKNNLVESDEINNQSKIITIDNREIDCSLFKINIIKNLNENAKTNSVKIDVDITDYKTIKITDNENIIYDLDQIIKTKTEQEKEMLFLECYNHLSGNTYSSFQEILNELYENGEIEEPTKEKYVSYILGDMEGLENTQVDPFNFIVAESAIVYTFSTGNNIIGEINMEENVLYCYKIINPENEETNNYIVNENGEYVFKIIDTANNEEYIRTVKIENIDPDLKNVEIIEPDYSWYCLGKSGTDELIKINDLFIMINNQYIEFPKEEMQSEYMFNGFEVRELLRKNGINDYSFFDFKVIDENNNVYFFYNVPLKYCL